MNESIIQNLAHWKGRRVVVAMSGGIDSSLSAVLLHRAGADVVGLHMRVWHDDGLGDEEIKGTCCSPSDVQDARRVAGEFGFSFYSIDFQADFRRLVIEPFIGNYLSGRTPNPCVLCNNQLKLGSLLAKARAYGAESVATGHYGRVIPNEATGRHELHCSEDPAKDQTYYLFGLTQGQLSRLVMPLGSLTKQETRHLAKELGLHLHDKPESMDICFVPDNDYRRFLREEGGVDPTALGGSILDTEGKTLGHHDGIHNFTIGQRRGLGVSAERPLYVVELNVETQTVVVGFKEEGRGCELEATKFNWVSIAPSAEPFRARVKIRYRSEARLATIFPDPEDLSRVRVRFDDDVDAITPGQAAVVYDEKEARQVLGGGWILREVEEKQETA
jgi:tRNA-specific 2-thiouridylase